jgi:hypothetical protein
MATTEIQEPPASPTHRAIMSMVDNYTHFESTYRQYPQAAAPVLEQVSLLRAALEVFRVAVENEKTGEASAPPYEATAAPPEVATPEETEVATLEETEEATAPLPEVAAPEEATAPLPEVAALEEPGTDHNPSIVIPTSEDAILTPAEMPLSPVVIQTVEPDTPSPINSSTGPSGTSGQESIPDSTDGPIALSTQDVNSDL